MQAENYSFLLIFKGIHFGRHFGRLSVALSASRENASLVINGLIDFKGVNEIAPQVTHVLLIFKGVPRILRGRQ